MITTQQVQATTQPKLVLCETGETGIEGMESYSPFCLKVHRALNAAGLTYERRFGKRPSDHKAHNPIGQVPVLLIDGEAVYDSTRILQRIDTMPNIANTGALTRGLDARERGEAWLWEELADTALNGFLVSARWADDRNWPLVKDAYFGKAPWFVRTLIAPKLRRTIVSALVMRDVWRAGPDACWERFLTTLNSLEARAPERGFWLGDTISVADVALFGQLHALRTHLTAFQRDQLAFRDRLSAYLDRVDAATRAVAASASISGPQRRVVRAA